MSDNKKTNDPQKEGDILDRLHNSVNPEKGYVLLRRSDVQWMLKELTKKRDSSQDAKDAEWGRALWKWIREFMDENEGSMAGFDIDELLAFAVKHGRAWQEAYDPDKHGDMIEAEPGAMIWRWSDNPNELPTSGKFP